MSRLTKDNYTDDLFEKQKELIKIDEYHEIHYSQANYNEDLWNAVKEKEDLEEQIGCPLEVIDKALKNGIWYEDVANRMTHIGVGLDTANYDCEYILREYNNETRFLPRNYKKTWWLKEDRSM